MSVVIVIELSMKDQYPVQSPGNTDFQLAIEKSQLPSNSYLFIDNNKGNLVEDEKIGELWPSQTFRRAWSTPCYCRYFAEVLKALTSTV